MKPRTKRPRQTPGGSRNRSRGRIAGSRGLLLCCVLPLLSACAFRNPENTPLTTWVGERFGVEDGGALKTAAFVPVALPLGIVDTVVVHPIQVLDDSYEDTADDLWRNRNLGTATESYFLLPRAALTPPRFAGSWLMRSLFDLDPAVEETEGEGEEGSVGPPSAKSTREQLERQIEERRVYLERWRATRADADQQIQRLEAEIQALEAERQQMEQADGG